MLSDVIPILNRIAQRRRDAMLLPALDIGRHRETLTDAAVIAAPQNELIAAAFAFMSQITRPARLALSITTNDRQDAGVTVQQRSKRVGHSLHGKLNAPFQRYKGFYALVYELFTNLTRA